MEQRGAWHISIFFPYRHQEVIDVSFKTEYISFSSLTLPHSQSDIWVIYTKKHTDWTQMVVAMVVARFGDQLLSFYAKKAFYKLIQYANMIITICKFGHFWLIKYVNMIDTVCKIGHFFFMKNVRRLSDCSRSHSKQNSV